VAREGTHFEVDVLPTFRSPRIEAALRLTVSVLMLVFALVFVWYGWGYATFGYAQTSELTGINMLFMSPMGVVTSHRSRRKYASRIRLAHKTDNRLFGPGPRPRANR
jgi:TRAP-type C4-dicarboxylate transport system permease small subunit